MSGHTFTLSEGETPLFFASLLIRGLLFNSFLEEWTPLDPIWKSYILQRSKQKVLLFSFLKLMEGMEAGMCLCYYFRKRGRVSLIENGH